MATPINQAFVLAGTPLDNGTAYVVVEDLSMNAGFSFSGLRSGPITVDGSGYTVTAADQWLGLFSRAVSVSNLGILSSGSTAGFAGWFFARYVTGTATNCYSTGTINNFNGGGIFGANSTSGTATNCYSTGVNLGTGGGIFGANSRSGTATNCYSTGAMRGELQGGGGIFGLNSRSGTANACYSTGTMRNSAGGIFGANSTSGTATNCYSTGAMSGELYGGGGIFGTNSTSGTANACYSTGTMDNNTGGIFGSDSTYCAATNCYSTGAQNSGNSGGIFGGFCGGSATNCYSTGAIGYFGGGIFGRNSASGTATNCYSTGALGVNAGPIFSGDGLPGTATNVYFTAGGLWSDASANATGALIGYPGQSPPVWFSYNNIPNTPYRLVANPPPPPTLINQAFVNAGTALNIGADYVVVEDLTMTTGFSFSGPGSGPITVDGSGHTITAPGNWSGLFSQAVTVSNLGVLSSGSTARFNAGWFFANGVVGGTATNCYSTGTINDNGGGIFGANSTSGTATNCYSTGAIRNDNLNGGGGIFGYYSLSGTATNCYSTGTIDNSAGGIFGSNSRYCAATNCYSTGAQTYGYSGGIFGSSCGGSAIGSGGSATNCYSTGAIGGGGGGIYGSTAGSSSVTNSYSTGTLGSGAGPIYGVDIRGTTTITNVYSTAGGPWSDASANATGALIGYPGQSPPVWFSYNNVPNTPYVLVENPPPSNNANLQLVQINGTPLTASGGAYTYAFDSSASTIPAFIVAEESHAVVSIQTLSRISYVSGSLSLLFAGINPLTIQVVSQSRLSTVTYPLTITTPPLQINQAFIVAGSALVDGNSYVVVEDLSMNAPFSIPGSGSGIILDGSGHTITAPGNWPGLFSRAVTVSNLGILSSGATQDYAGWFFQGYNVQGGTATNCYSTGEIGEQGGGIFGYNSSGTAINCYSTGTINYNAGGIIGNGSIGTATNCYSTGTIGGLGGAGGGIFGTYCGGTITNCYSTGAILPYSGGIIGYQSNASITNCYSTGVVGSGAGPIFAVNYSGTATNVYFTEGGLWSDASANATGALTDYPGEPNPVWLRYNNVPDTPYLLVNNPQDPSSNANLQTVEVNGVPLTAGVGGAYTYAFDSSATTIPVFIRSEEPHAIVSIQDLSGGGDVTGSLTGLVTGPNSFTINVTSQDGTVTTPYPLTITRPLLFINQAFVDAGISLVNGNTYIVVEDLSMNDPFTIAGDGSGITVDGSGHTVTAPDQWLGLFSRAITVSNLGVLSSGSTQGSAGWFFANSVGGTATNCYSTGAIGINSGGIFGTGSPVSASATNCYSTGVIGAGGGGIFAAIGRGSATNCYSTGAIGTGGGGVFGYGTRGSATNCYNTGAIGQDAGGIFGSSSGASASATNCYSTGPIFGPGSAGSATNCYSTNGGLWSDTDADAELTGYPGQPSPVWLRYNDVVDTPYLLVENSQPPSDNVNLQTVEVNGVPLVASGGAYSYTFDTNSTTVPVVIVTQEPHAIVSIQDLSGGGDVSGSLTGLVLGPNSFTIQVVAQSGSPTVTYPLTIMIRTFIDQAFVNASSALVNGFSYVVVEDLSMNAPFLFAGDGSGITVDGSGHTVTAPDQWPGLFNHAISVSNLGILSSGSTQGSVGWFFTSGVGGTATNCYSTGVIGSQGGGIFGQTSSGSATNCYSTGAIGDAGGGIFGSDSVGSATNCYSTGIAGSDASGIFGFSSFGSATNCYFTNGELWSDVSADAQLTGYPGQRNPVWFLYNNVPDTPYLLVANPQPPNSKADLQEVVVNGVTLVASGNAYPYTVPLNTASVSVSVRTVEPRASVSILGTDLSGGGDLAGSLTGLVLGPNLFTIQVVSDDRSITAAYALTITNPLPIVFINQAFVNANTALENETAYIVTEDLSMNAGFPFSDTGNNTTFDGSGHTVTAANQWPGLFSQSISVSNLGILSTGTTEVNAGWFFANTVGGSATNCYSTGAIGASGGGIFGHNSSGNAINCYNTGAIGQEGGGIFGADSAGSARNCYSTGIASTDASGIFGLNSTGSTPFCYFTNGGLWSDTDADAQLTGYPGEPNPVWLRYNNVVDTPYLLVANPQPPSDNDNLQEVRVNGIVLDVSNNTYTYALSLNAASVPVFVRSEEPHAIVSLQDLSGGGDVSGSLPLVIGSNSFTIQVVAQSGFSTATYSLTITNPVPPINQAFVDASTALVNGVAYTVVEDLTMNSGFLFAGDGTGITIDGSGYTVTAADNWPGLFSVAISVSNLGVLSLGSTQIATGWFFANGVGGSATNCYSTGDIGSSGGGIFGQTSSGSATNCHSAGVIGTLGGGIFGNASSGTAIDCYSTGAISESGGGIFGLSSAGTAINCHSIGAIDTLGGGIFGQQSSGSSAATNCYSIGDISSEGGGIFGYNSSGSATNCYSTGDIAIFGGGIFGRRSIVGSSATDCYSTGIIGESAGGIFGYQSQDSAATDCYSTGVIGLYAGGIFGQNSSGSAINCYSTGTIGQQAGGIIGGNSSGSAINCYSTGTIGQQAGGIFGQVGSGSATNCYCTGTIGDFGGGIFGDYSTGPATNCYSTGAVGDNAGPLYGNGSTGTPTHYYFTRGGLWNDALANATGALTGYPGEPDPVWLRYNNVPNTPYLLENNSQPPSDNATLQTVEVNGVPLVASGNAYSYIINISASTLPVFIRTQEPHAIVSIQDLSGGGDVSGSLTGLVAGSNSFTIQVVAQSGSPTVTYSLTITTLTLIDQAFVDASTLLVNEVAYVVVEDLSMNDGFLFEGDGSGITVDGSGHTVTAPDQWLGLFSRAISVSNLGILSSGSTQSSAGWFFANSVGGTATNCYSTGIIGILGGGIFGQDSSGTAINCYSTGIIGTNGGGIFGTGSSASATNCYSTGVITASSGGIFGILSTGTAANCYSTGNAIAANTGGIFGSSSSGTATDCYSTGIMGPNGGGIFGYQSSGSATNCYSIGAIGQQGGGIFGAGAVGGSATNCYSTGTLGSEADGIFGYDYTGTITNCYSTNGGLWSDAAADAQLTGYPGEPDPVWLRYDDVVNTPYLLVANPQPPSDNVNLQTVEVNGVPLTASGGAYTYTFDSSSTTVPVVIVTQEPHAIVSIQDLSGGGDVSGNLTGLVAGPNSFTINVTSQDGTATATYSLTITTLTLINQAFVDASTALVNGNPYLVVEDLSMNAPFLFAGDGSGITVDGSGYTVTAPNNWPGLFSRAISVSNLGILPLGSARTTAGWFFADGVGGSATNCYSTGTIGGGGGGIFGGTSSGSATNCYSTGAIGTDGGGIFGFQSTGTATNCYSTGVIGTDAGAIFGDLSTGTTTNCYFTDGGLWSDASANATGALTGYPGQPDPVWLRYNNVVNTPYLLVANPQPPSNNATLQTVVVNGSTLTASGGAYTYAFNSNASTIPVAIVTQEPHAIVSVQDLSGGGNVSGNLSGLVAGPNSFTINVTSQDGTVTTTYPLTITSPVPGPAPCFPAGTNILTASGYKAVEKLMQGELVMTADGRQVPIKLYGKHIRATTSVTAPYRVPKGTFGLQNDLVLSPDHAFQIGKGLWMLPKRAALLSDRVEQVGVGSPITYYHVECPQYLRDNLVVDGSVVESYGGKQISKDPYTYSEALQGYTRPSVATTTAIKNLTKA